MRVYSDLGPDGSIGSLKLKQLFEPYPFVDLCNVTRVMEIRNITRPLFPMTWRFLPLMDPTVDRMLCRDMDSIITFREVSAVHQWLERWRCHISSDARSSVSLRIVLSWM
jgi:hypothetical protein